MLYSAIKEMLIGPFHIRCSVDVAASRVRRCFLENGKGAEGRGPKRQGRDGRPAEDGRSGEDGRQGRDGRSAEDGRSGEDGRLAMLTSTMTRFFFLDDSVVDVPSVALEYSNVDVGCKRLRMKLASFR